MYLLKPVKVDEHIIHFLLGGELSTSLLLEDVRKMKPETTKQGFYAALRKLKKDDIVITYKKKASLNTTRLKDMRDKFNATQAMYGDINSPDFLSLEDKESVAYNFSTIKNMDTFWGHTWNVLTGIIPTTEPLFIYDPHYWFYIGRHDLEKRFRKEITGTGRQFLMTVGGKKPLDRVIKKAFDNPYLQCNQDEVFPNKHYYMTIIGDYIAETHFDPKISARIERIFDENAAVTPQVTAELKEILEARVKSKIKISRNKTRAEKLKRRLGRNFYIIKGKQTDRK